MKVQQFLEHQGLNQNPFSQEDAQTDPLFQKLCSSGTFHPAWGRNKKEAEQRAAWNALSELDNKPIPYPTD